MRHKLSRDGVTLGEFEAYPGDCMYTAKIEGSAVKLFDASTGSLTRTIACSSYNGAIAVNLAGDKVAVTCGDGQVRLYDIRTGSLELTV